MDNYFVPYLCGGIFFSFLIELHNSTAKEFHSHMRTNKIVNQTKIMENLIRAINPDYCGYDNQDTFKKTVSEYRSCKSDGGKIIPFDREDIRAEFDKSVREKYRDVLERMKEFTDKSFPECNNQSSLRRMIKNTLMLIRDDTSIENDALFYINEDGSPISKGALPQKEYFNFQSFLVGIWHYIITKPTKNQSGEKTFEKLFPKYTDKGRKLDTSCLKDYDPVIKITVIEVSGESSSKEVYEQKNMVEMAKTAKNGKLAVKIFYEGSLLENEDKNLILSNSQIIIDLNEHPDTCIADYPNSTIYKLTTEFEFKTHFLSLQEEIVRLYCNVNSINISGTTSIENWKSRSILNEMRFRIKHSCTAWFSLVSCGENEYSAQFLLIGRIIQ